MRLAICGSRDRNLECLRHLKFDVVICKSCDESFGALSKVRDMPKASQREFVNMLGAALGHIGVSVVFPSI